MGILNFFGGISDKVSQIEGLINLGHVRVGELLEFADEPDFKMHESISNMLGGLYDDIYKLYVPNKVELDKYGITLKANRFNHNQSSRASIAYYVAIQFKTILALEDDFKTQIFKDYMQREFARSIMPFQSDFINGLR